MLVVSVHEGEAEHELRPPIAYPFVSPFLGENFVSTLQIRQYNKVSNIWVNYILAAAIVQLLKRIFHMKKLKFSAVCSVPYSFEKYIITKPKGI